MTTVSLDKPRLLFDLCLSVFWISLIQPPVKVEKEEGRDEGLTAVSDNHNLFFWIA